MALVLAAGTRRVFLPDHVSPTPPAAFAIPNGLVGYWGFDADCMDVTQGLAFDLSGNNNTGTLAASPPLAQGQVGQALKFDGSTTYVNCGSSALLNPAAMSMTAWVNMSALTNAYSAIVSRVAAGGATATFQIFVKSSGKLAVYVGASTSVSYDGSGTYTLPTGQWY